MMFLCDNMRDTFETLSVKPYYIYTNEQREKKDEKKTTQNKRKSSMQKERETRFR